MLKKFLNRESLGRLLRYFISGGSAACVEIVLYWLLTVPVGILPTYAHVAVYTVTFWMSFLLNKFWTFKSRENFLPQLVKYGILFVINLTVTSLLLSGLVAAGLHAMLAKLIVMATVVCWNFLAYRYVIYK
ncbi:MAG: GtrA family protein [Clostridia bacterium]|nr:GtrA family protein [Clostridia bacterium]